jgi:predicted metal-dependent phosphoesterase TrpH
MCFSDLHIHSNYSDGILTPLEIISVSNSKKLKHISITDHDTIESQYYLSSIDVKNEIKTDLRIIPGIELSTKYCEYEIHILGYFIDINNVLLRNTLDSIRKSRYNRAQEIIFRLKKLGIEMNLSDIGTSDFMTIGRLHIAKLLVSKGYSSTIKDAFNTYLLKGRPAYIERLKLNYNEALKLITQCGGVPVLAHPGEIYMGLNIEKLLKEFKVYGLKGIEVYHPSHSDLDSNKFYNLAKKYNLVITGGSDYHGHNFKSQIEIGSMGIDEDLTKKFLKLYNK